MGKGYASKAISTCYLDLLYQLATMVRVNPGEARLLESIVRAVEEIKKSEGVAGGKIEFSVSPKISPSRVERQAEWEKSLCRVFNVQSLDQEELTETLYFYPVPKFITPKDYETLLLVFGKAQLLLETNEPQIHPSVVSDYFDAIHILPEAFKNKIDRKRFFKIYILPFNKKWPNFISDDEFLILKKYSKSTDKEFN